MFIVALYLLSTLFAPVAPLVSMTVVPQPQGDHLTVVTYLLSSDSRYTDYIVDVAGITALVNAPLHISQTVTTTIPLGLPPMCNAHISYSFVVTARVLTDTFPFARTDVGGLVTRLCPLRLYIP